MIFKYIEELQINSSLTQWLALQLILSIVQISLKILEMLYEMENSDRILQILFDQILTKYYWFLRLRINIFLYICNNFCKQSITIISKELFKII